MTSGGARPGAGRPPADQSRAKDRAAKRAAKAGIAAVDDGDWLTLAREGRKGNAPAWPLSKPAKATPESRRELELWRRLWKSPQAIGWDTVGVDRDHVAMYVRYRLEAEEPKALVGTRNLVRQYADSLGLTGPGLRMLHWRIGQPARQQRPMADEASAPAPQRPAPGRSAKERFTLLVGDGGA